MDKEFDVLVAGELNIDLILNNIDGYPTIGKEVIGNEMNITMGSSSAIFACNLSSLGARVTFLGKIGEDNFGNKILSDFNIRGVDTTHIIRTCTNTGITIVLNYGEDRAMVTYPGAMVELGINDILDSTLCKARHLHVSSLFLQTALKPDIVNLFKRAKSHNLTTSLDPQWDPAETWEINLPELLPYVDIFLPNEAELFCLTKKDSIEEALAEIKKYANMVLIKRGKMGSVLFSNDQIFQSRSFLNEKVVDAIGAGDSFNAGVIFKFLKGESPLTCQEFGNLIGAISTTKAGGTTAFSSFNEIMKIAKEKFNYEG